MPLLKVIGWGRRREQFDGKGKRKNKKVNFWMRWKKIEKKSKKRSGNMLKQEWVNIMKKNYWKIFKIKWVKLKPALEVRPRS